VALIIVDHVVPHLTDVMPLKNDVILYEKYHQ